MAGSKQFWLVTNASFDHRCRASRPPMMIVCAILHVGVESVLILQFIFRCSIPSLGEKKVGDQNDNLERGQSGSK
ncbi:hypothetical protein OBBRIDRAFT_788616 [Obba rivulosa]|uniref:Uncharacterized protein n=1 Tax=Obba rivulosa TaxID=1052685 RepID=A0A8E2DSR8_9APHY|nr:hypothetical protein OBBRIDRAFT_788616 [Obba rivulosa]